MKLSVPSLWKCQFKYLENPQINTSKRGFTRIREKSYIEYNRDIDTELLEYGINFPQPINNREFYTSDENLVSFILNMFDKVHHPRKVKSTKVPNVYVIN